MRRAVLGAWCDVLSAVLSATCVVLGATGVVLGASSPALAQTATVPRVTFDEAVSRAIERNPAVAQAATAVARADALLQQARAATMPGVGLAVANTTLDTARGFDGLVTQPQNQFAFSATASVPVLAAARWAAVTQSKDQIEVARLSTADVRQQIAVSAAQAYLAVIATQRQVQVDERSLENARAHLDYAQRRLDGGAGSRLDQLRAAQSAASADALLEATRFALRRAQEALGVLLAEDGPVDAGAEPVFDTVLVDGDSWMNARPDVQFQQSVHRAAERVLRDSWKDWLPTATASFDPQLIAPAGLFQPSRTWRFTVSLSQPVFDGGARRASTRLREVAIDQARLTLDLLQIQARSEVRLASDSLTMLERAQASARLAATQAAEVLQISNTAFQLGATTNIEVIDAQRSARIAETVAAIAEDAVRRARLELLVATGRFPR